MSPDDVSFAASLNKLLLSEDLQSLKVTYNDLHGLHGGLTLSIDGAGKVEQQSLRAQVGTPVTVKQSDIKKLITLLIELQAWKQLVPERMPVPDESRATLTIEIEGQSSLLWEWFNDLSANNRLLRIATLMKEIAWKNLV